MRSTYISILFTLLFALVAAPAAAEYLPGDQAKEDRVPSIERILAYLQQDSPILSRFDFRNMSADPVADLAQLATGKQSDVVRARAIQSLALYDRDDRVAKTLTELMASTRKQSRIFPVVIVAYGQVHGEDVAAELSQLAQNKDTNIRLAAITALGRFGGQDGYESLLKLAAQESNPAVRARIEDFTR
jgi:hypothetical protein